MIFGDKFKLKSILLGVATGLILSNFVAFVIGFVVSNGFGSAVLVKFANSVGFFIFGTVLGIVIAGLAGWATAMSARVNKLGNALAMSVILLLVSAWFYSLLSVPEPTWYLYLNRLLLIPAALVGAYLQDVLSAQPAQQ